MSGDGAIDWLHHEEEERHRRANLLVQRAHAAYDAAWGEPYRVFHWETPELPHVDVFYLHSTTDRTLLATAGMSAFEMPHATERTERRVELFVRAQPGMQPADDRILALGLRVTALAPFRGRFALAKGDTISDPRWDWTGAKAILGCWAFVAPDRTEPWIVALEHDLDVTLLEAVPLFPAEASLANHIGTERLIELLHSRYGVLTSLHRPCVARTETATFRFHCPIVDAHAELIQLHLRTRSGAIGGGRAIACSKAGPCKEAAPGAMRPCTWGRFPEGAVPRPSFLPTDTAYPVSTSALPPYQSDDPPDRD
jgi:hypothetical protein